MSFDEKRSSRTMASLNPEFGLRCIKYLLCAVNFLFVLTGIMIISIGSTIFAKYEDFSHFLDARYFSPAMLLVILGTAIFVIAFLGCCGALKESTCMVLVFAVSLVMILFLEFSAAVASYAYRKAITDVIDTKINRTMHMYERNVEAKEAIDFLQLNLRCCGYTGPLDWTGILTNSSNPYNVPDSCCYADDMPQPSNENMHCSRVYGQGCYSDLAFLVDRSALYVITGAVMIALLQFSGIVFACILGRSIRYHKTMREMRKWQQHSPRPSEPDEPLQRNAPTDTHVFM